jgi:hypothetical protein
LIAGNAPHSLSRSPDQKPACAGFKNKSKNPNFEMSSPPGAE